MDSTLAKTLRTALKRTEPKGTRVLVLERLGNKIMSRLSNNNNPFPRQSCMLQGGFPLPSSLLKVSQATRGPRITSHLYTRINPLTPDVLKLLMDLVEGNKKGN